MWRTTEQTRPSRSPDLLHGPLRSGVRRTDPENNRVHEDERVAEHQSLDFAIGASAPMSADQKCPADFDFTPLCVVCVIPAGANDRTCCALDEREGAPAGNRAIKEFSENRLRVAVSCRVKLPDQWVGRSRKHFVPVLRPNGPYEDRFPGKGRLQVGHMNSRTSGHDRSHRGFSSETQLVSFSGIGKGALMLSRISVGGLIAVLIQGASAQTAAVPDFSSASAGKLSCPA